MSIKYEFKKKLEGVTRRLGTSADSYIKEYFNIALESQTKIKNVDELVKQSNRFQKASEATIKQIEEVYYVFGLIDVEKNFIINNFKNMIEFKSQITAAIKYKISNKDDFEDIYKNAYKLLNNFIYINGVEILNEDNFGVDEFYDQSMKKRTSEFETSFVNFDEELNEILKKNFFKLIESCGYERKNNKQIVELEKYIKNTVDDRDVSIAEIEKFKSKIETRVRNVFDLLELIKSEDIVVEIPFYQREYVWTEDLIEKFIHEIADNRNKMLNIGNILIHNKMKDQKTYFSIVDGQQRLTSIMLFVNVLSKYLMSVDLNEFNISDEYKSLVRIYSDKKFIKNLVNKSNQEYIDDLNEVFDREKSTISSMKESSVIKINYKIIDSFISKYDDSSKVNLFKKLNYILSTTTSDGGSDEIELFISTNSSRKPLTNYELIRSFLISKVESSVVTAEIDSKLKKLNSLIDFNQNDDKEKDVFFNLYLDYIDKIESGDTSSIKDIFKRFRKSRGKQLATNADLLILLDEIISIADTYLIIRGIKTQEGIYINDFLVSLGSGLKSTSIYDLFLIYFVQKLQQISDAKNRNILLNNFRKILLMIEQFEIKWKLFTFRGDSLSGAMSKIFVNFYEKVDPIIEEGDYNEVFKIFNDQINNGEGFVEDIFNNKKFENLESFVENENIKSQTIALKILNRVAFNLFNGGIEYKTTSTTYYSFKNPSIEHIYPRTNSKWAEDDKTNASLLDPYLENIGNKFIYNKDDNSSVGNKTFFDKIEKYKENNDIKNDRTLKFEYEIENEKLEFDLLSKLEWTVDDIKLREKHIIKSLIKIWNS